MSEKTAGYSVTHHPLGPGDLWKTAGLKLPAYIQNVAKGLMEAGHSRSRAIQMAIGVVRRWAAGGGKVGPEVRAASAKAVAEFEAARARAKATPNRSHNHNRPRGSAVDLAYSQEGQRVTTNSAAKKAVNYGSGPSQKARAGAQAKGQAFKSGRYPIRNVADLSNAIQAFGRAKPEDKAALKRFIIRRARALGASDKIPKSWTTKELANLHSRVVELAGKPGRGPYERHVPHTKQFGKKKGNLAVKGDWKHEYNPQTPVAGALKAKHITNADRTSSGAVKPGKTKRVQMPDPPSARPFNSAKTTPGKATEPKVKAPVAPSAPPDGAAKGALMRERNTLQAKVKAGTATPAERTRLNKIVKLLQTRAKKG